MKDSSYAISFRASSYQHRTRNNRRLHQLAHSNSMTPIRKVLHSKNPRCHWCKRLTKITYRATGEVTPFDEATVDHIVGLLDPRRQTMSFAEAQAQVVLACYSCNQKRNMEDSRAHQALDGVEKELSLAFLKEKMTRGEFQRRLTHVFQILPPEPLKQMSIWERQYVEGYNACVADIKKNILELPEWYKLGTPQTTFRRLVHDWKEKIRYFFGL